MQLLADDTVTTIAEFCYRHYEIIKQKIYVLSEASPCYHHHHHRRHHHHHHHQHHHHHHHHYHHHHHHHHHFYYHYCHFHNHIFFTRDHAYMTLEKRGGRHWCMAPFRIYHKNQQNHCQYNHHYYRLYYHHHCMPFYFILHIYEELLSKYSLQYLVFHESKGL